MSSILNTEQRDSRVFILEQAIPLFAAQGYSGVSMRDLSKAVGMSAAALYHHFPDKKTLYLEVMAHAFAGKTAVTAPALSVDSPPLQRLECFIENLVGLLGSDPNYRALVQWELLDDDETRLKLVAEQVFLEPFQAISALAEDLFSDSDPHMLAISMIGLVLYHFETAPMRAFLPGWRPEHSDPKAITLHLMQLLTKSLGSNQDGVPRDTRGER